MTRGLVSVIIPTNNRADYVVKAVRSAQAQTYPRKQARDVHNQHNLCVVFHGSIPGFGPRPCK